VQALDIIAVLLLVSFAATQLTPFMRERVRRWYQISFLSPRPGELGVLVDPPYSDIEALIFKVSRTMFPDNRIPFGEIVMVLEVDGDVALVVWGDCLARVPRRWLRRVKT
jgi:hypothetical protein